MNGEEIIQAIDGLWIFTAAVLCFLMQAGFGLLEVGSIRAKNAQNVMLKNLLVRYACSLFSLSLIHVLVVLCHVNEWKKHRIADRIKSHTHPYNRVMFPLSRTAALPLLHIGRQALV
jgi:ammonia channel protein AmtB